MKLQTKFIGEVTISEKQLIRFPLGLPGFVDETEYALLEIPGNDLFQTLQSTKTPELAFIVTDPYHFYQAYEFDLDNNVRDNLLIRQKNQVGVLTIVTLKSPFKNSTINLKAPLIININEKVAKQYILNTEDYSTKAPITPSHHKKTGGE